MRKNLSIALTLSGPDWPRTRAGACHTTAGAGEDVSASGHTITHSANKLTP